MAKVKNKAKRKNKKLENEDKSYLISYFEDHYNSFSGTRSYSVKTKCVTAESKIDAYSKFIVLNGNKGIVNIIPLDD
jgi:hypothetical protein